MSSLTPNGSYISDHLQEILSQWGVEGVTPKKVLMGNSGSVWIVKTDDQKFILRNAGQNSDYLTFQMKIIKQLSDLEFPYLLPKFRTTIDSCQDYVDYQDSRWILYDFIEGTSVTKTTINQAREIGCLVARFNNYAEKGCQNIEENYLARWALQIFNEDYIYQMLGNNNRLILSDRYSFPLMRIYLEKSIAKFLEEYTQLAKSYKEVILSMPKIPVYMDWHGHNIIQRYKKIVGIIDFDSLTIAPSILDFQNGLMHCFDALRGCITPKSQAFIEGYFPTRKLSQMELHMIYPVMIERLVWWLASLQENQLKGWRVSILILRISMILNWLIDHQEHFQSFLASSAKNANPLSSE